MCQNELAAFCVKVILNAVLKIVQLQKASKHTEFHQLDSHRWSSQVKRSRGGLPRVSVLTRILNDSSLPLLVTVNLAINKETRHRPR